MFTALNGARGWVEGDDDGDVALSTAFQAVGRADDAAGVGFGEVRGRVEADFEAVGARVGAGGWVREAGVAGAGEAGVHDALRCDGEDGLDGAEDKVVGVGDEDELRAAADAVVDFGPHLVVVHAVQVAEVLCEHVAVPPAHFIALLHAVVRAFRRGGPERINHMLLFQCFPHHQVHAAGFVQLLLQPLVEFVLGKPHHDATHERGVEVPLAEEDI